MDSFTLTPVEKGILRCRHSGEFTPEEVQALARFLEDYHGKLLVDLTESTPEECTRHLRELRPMMPTAAIFGAALDHEALRILETYYTHPVRYFETEEEAVVWLREQ